MKSIDLIKGSGLAIIFGLVMLFAFAVSTSECAAADVELTSFYIECGEGHEASAVKIEELFNEPGFTYQNTSATRRGTTLEVTCEDDLTIKQMKTAIGDCLFGWGTSVFLMENNELFTRSMIGIDPIEEYDDKKQFVWQCSEFDSWLVKMIPFERTLYLLWEKPFDKPIDLTISTPQCGSTERPEITCDTLSFMSTFSSAEPVIKPIWYLSKPNGQAMHFTDWDNNSYKGTLEGGTPYYACAVFEAPWGYYFPLSISNATANGKPADVFLGTRSGEYEELFVGAYITPTHVWDDNWSVTKDPTCSAVGTETRYCTSGCGVSQDRPVDIAPDAHSWGDWTTAKKPTALNDGIEQRVCKYNDSHIEERALPATGVSGTLLAQMKASGKTKLKLSWTKIKGAEGYDIFFAKCKTKESKTKLKRVKTFKGNSTFTWSKSGLKKNTAYKAQVKAFAYKNGKKTYVSTSPDVHVFTSGGNKKYTNPKSVSVNKATVTLNTGKAFQLKGKVAKLSAKKALIPKAHGPVLRFISSDKAVATVSKAGIITAKGSGKCTVYVYAVNGVRKAVTVTVE